MPKYVAQAYAQDEKNGNTLWADAITKYMKAMSPSFRKLDNGEIVPIGHQRINCHMILMLKLNISVARLGW